MTRPLVSDLDSLSLASASRALAAGALSAPALLERCLTRIEETDALGAWVSVDADGARAIIRETRAIGSRLRGIPVGIKDNVDVCGVPTRWGSSTTSAVPASADAAIVGLLRDAGAVVLGKLATHEITYGVTTRGVANPWDTARLSGGSSGGSAVAVAVGACLLAVGSDTAGSVRIPAALCGVAGLMGPRLPTDGIRPLAPSLDTAGLLARTAEDLAVAWEALTGTAAGAGAGTGTGTERFPGPAPVRIGVVGPGALGPVDRDVAHQVDEALARLRNGGVALVSVDVPDFTEFARARAVVIGAEALAVQRAAGAWPQRADEFGAAVRMELARAESIDDDALRSARAEQRRLADRLRAALGDVDALAWPTTPQVAPRADDGSPVATADRRLAGVLTRLCGPVNASGLSAVTVPCGLGTGGMPVGLQLVALDEERALGAALAYERLGPPIGRPAAVSGTAPRQAGPDSEL